MNNSKRLNQLMIIFVLMTSSVVAVAHKGDVKDRIEALKVDIIKAHGNSKINKVERDSLLGDWERLRGLYKDYYKDSKLSRPEIKELDSKIKKFDLNLFRKKYDKVTG